MSCYKLPFKCFGRAGSNDTYTPKPILRGKSLAHNTPYTLMANSFMEREIFFKNGDELARIVLHLSRATNQDVLVDTNFFGIKKEWRCRISKEPYRVQRSNHSVIIKLKIVEDVDCAILDNLNSKIGEINAM